MMILDCLDAGRKDDNRGMEMEKKGGERGGG
jgi:hypothetical protein